MIEEVWYTRFDILERRIIRLKDAIEAEMNFSRAQTLSTFVTRLREFADFHFKFFFNGFNNGSLEKSDQYPPHHVIYVILEQISFDLEALSWAIDQRRAKAARDEQRMSEALEIADKLSLQALQPAIERFNLDNLNVITYFQKFPEIRMIPYANIALIGIPYTCVALPFSGAQLVYEDYLAIPHEVAHYVYWHGAIEGKPLRQYLTEKLAGLLDWGEEWFEEVFADVYGCLIAGPVIAKIFQDLQLRFNREQFVYDDSEHPVPILRPHIYTKVLRKRFAMKWAQKLNQRWLDERSTIANNYSFKHKKSGESKSIADALSMVDSCDDEMIHPDSDKPLDIMINTILQVIGQVDSLKWWHGYLSGSSPNFYKRFGNHFKKHQEDNFKELDIPTEYVKFCEPQELHSSWLNTGWDELRETLIMEQDSSEKADEEINKYKIQNKIPEKVWLKVFQAGGWATKGPDDNPTSG